MRERITKFLSVIVLSILLILHSCILDEFKFGEIYLKEEWEMEIISPLFYGNFTFKDLACECDNVPLPTDQLTTVLVSPDDTLTVPTYLFYEPVLIIDGFNFLIEGDDYLTSGAMHFTVTNGSPFPLQLQMYFYEKEKPLEKEPAFITPFFAAGTMFNQEIISLKTNYILNFTAEQLERFKKSNRIDFISKFNQPEAGFQTDTLKADYPVNISIVFSGNIHGKYE